MIDFACKQFNMDDIVKCGLGLTRTEFRIFQFFLSSSKEWTTHDLAKKINLNVTTVQKATKKLSEKGVIKRNQINLEGGGYVFVYVCVSKPVIRKVIKEMIGIWFQKVQSHIDRW